MYDYTEDEMTALKDEVARLREELTEVASPAVEYWRAACMTERATHEATKAELDRYATALGAAEARVAELEREADTHGKDWASAVRHYNNAQARVAELERDVSVFVVRATKAERALDQARGLLERADRTANDVARKRLIRDALSVLRAHPATATPAATGAEHVYRCPACGGPAEKEQGT